MKRSEVAVFVLLTLIGAALAVGDRFLPERARPETPQQGGKFLSTTSYCPGLTARRGAEVIIQTANLGDETIHLRRRAAGEGRSTGFQEAEVPPHRRSLAPLSELGIPGGIGVVEAFGARTLTHSDVFLERVGVASTRCAVQPADRWLFAVASTRLGRDTRLEVGNPFGEEAVVGIRLLSSTGESSPSRLQGLVVPPLSKVSLFLGDFIRESGLFGLEVLASRGRVIVARDMRFDGREGSRGLAFDLGANAPSTFLSFAGGEVPPRGEENIVLANAGDKEALVEFEFHTETEQVSSPGLREVPLPAGQRIIIKVSDHLPRNIRHGTTVRALNGVPFVAERLTTGSLAGVRGMDSILALNSASEQWVVPVGTSFGGNDSLSVVNPGSTRAVISVSLITGRREERPRLLAGVPLDPGLRTTISLDPFLNGAAATALVTALSGEVVVEKHLVIGDPYVDFADSAARPL
ncbi:MAG: DUF5719 family protein [Actinomycetota bacterium]